MYETPEWKEHVKPYLESANYVAFHSFYKLCKTCTKRTLLIVPLLLLSCSKPCIECKPKTGEAYPIEICGDNATIYVGADSYVPQKVDRDKYIKDLEAQNYECLEMK